MQINNKTSQQKALYHCQANLGWKNAIIPSDEILEKYSLEPDTIYEHEPDDFFNTPRYFCIWWLDAGLNPIWDKNSIEARFE